MLKNWINYPMNSTEVCKLLLVKLSRLANAEANLQFEIQSDKHNKSTIF